jgi:hypothetical protein
MSKVRSRQTSAGAGASATPSRIKRNSSVPRQFQREHPCPSTGLQTGPCPGYIQDHIVPLRRGGADTVDNLQWEKTAEAKAKDRLE